MGSSVLRWLLPVALVLACTERGTETPPADPSPARAPEPVAPTEPAAPPEPVAPPEPAAPSEELEPGELSDADRVQAYVADCSHRFTVLDEDSEYEEDPQPVSECDYFVWEQNCASDPGDCWEKGEMCTRACSKPCNTCEDRCTTGCDECKATCVDGSTECMRKCAEARLGCRETCLDGLVECRVTDCAAKEDACSKAFFRKRNKKCPQCGKISDCFSEGGDGSGDDLVTVCARKFPRARKECFDWCWDYYETEPDDEL